MSRFIRGAYELKNQSPIARELSDSQVVFLPYCLDHLVKDSGYCLLDYTPTSFSAIE